jgi:hypothetical protein
VHVLLVLDQPERAGPCRVQAVVGAPALERGRRRDAAGDVAEGEQERREGHLQRDLQGAGVQRLRLVHRADLAAPDRLGRRIADPLQVDAHRLGVERGPVVELDALAQVDQIRPLVGLLPGLGQVRGEAALRVDPEQPVVGGAHRPPALEVSGQVRIERQRVREDRDGQGRRRPADRRRGERAERAGPGHPRNPRRLSQKPSSGRHDLILLSGAGALLYKAGDDLRQPRGQAGRRSGMLDVPP